MSTNHFATASSAGKRTTRFRCPKCQMPVIGIFLADNNVVLNLHANDIALCIGCRAQLRVVSDDPAVPCVELTDEEIAGFPSAWLEQMLRMSILIRQALPAALNRVAETAMGDMFLGGAPVSAQSIADQLREIARPTPPPNAGLFTEEMHELVDRLRILCSQSNLQMLVAVEIPTGDPADSALRSICLSVSMSKDYTGPLLSAMALLRATAVQPEERDPRG